MCNKNIALIDFDFIFDLQFFKYLQNQIGFECSLPDWLLTVASQGYKPFWCKNAQN